MSNHVQHFSPSTCSLALHLWVCSHSDPCFSPLYTEMLLAHLFQSRTICLPRIDFALAVRTSITQLAAAPTVPKPSLTRRWKFLKWSTWTSTWRFQSSSRSTCPRFRRFSGRSRCHRSSGRIRVLARCVFFGGLQEGLRCMRLPYKSGADLILLEMVI